MPLAQDAPDALPEPPPARDRRRVAVVAAVLLAGLAWRLLLAGLLVPAWEARANVGSHPDAYPQLAETLLRSGVFGYDASTPTTVRGPAFAVWLLLALALGAAGPAALGLWAGLPGLLCGGGLAHLVSRRAGPLIGGLAGLVAVLHPLPSFASARVMADEYYAVTGFLAVVCWAAALERREVRSVGWAAAAGSALAVHLLTRATGLLTLGALVLATVVVRRRPRRPAVLAIVALVALLPAALWSVRSSRLEGRPVFVHSLAGYNFWFGEALYRLGTDRGPGETRRLAMELMADESGIERLRDPRLWYGELPPREVAQLERRLVRAAVAHVARHPLDYAGRWAAGLARFWFAADDPARSRQYLPAVLPLLLLGGLGAARVIRRPDDRLGLGLLLVVLLHNAAYAGIWPMARMSVQVYPALVLLAGLGLDAALERYRRRHS